MRFLNAPSAALRSAVAAALCCCALWSSASLADADAAIRATVSAWAQAWSAQDVERYLAFYAPSFEPRGGRSREAWEKLRRSRVTTPRSIEVSIGDVEILLHDETRAAASFRQNYRSDRYQDSVNKTLELVLDGERWLIVAERVGSPVAKSPAAPASVAAPRAAPGIAAGLGALRILSALGEPLRAEIEIISLRPGEQNRVRARLASAEAFRRAGIAYRIGPGDVKTEISLRDGEPIVLVTTRDAVDEPILEMLIELAWASGRLQRRYAFLLDPPMMQASPPTTHPAPKPAPAVKAPRRMPSAPPTAASRPAAKDGEYRVLPGDTLAGIARARLHAGVTFEQTAIALYRTNSEAFVDGNINRLSVGRILKIPDRDAARAVDPEQAKETLRALMAGTAGQRTAIAAAAPTAPARVSVPATPKPAHSPDQVELARTEAAKARAAAEDDRIAKERALAETNSRVAELEKIYADLQKLLTIKDKQLADLEKRAAQARAATAAKTTAPASKPAILTPTKPASVPVKPEPTAKPPSAAKPPPASPAPQPDLVDEYLGDPLMQGGLGAVAFLLVGYGVYAWRKKTRAAQAWAGEMSWPGPSAAALAANAPPAPGAHDDAPTAALDEADPQGEVDVRAALPELDPDVERSSAKVDQSSEVGVTLKLDVSDFTGETPAPIEPQPIERGEIHFDIDEPVPEQAAPGAAAPASPDLQLATIEFDQTATEGSAAGETEADGEPKPLDSATKLDLAQAYREIADPGSARELLKEVIEQGDAAQQALAREMLADLG